MRRLAWTGKVCGGVGRGLGNVERGDRGLSLMVSVLRLSPPFLVTALGIAGEKEGRRFPIHLTPSQHRHRLHYKEPRLETLSSCVIWASWACFFKLPYVFVSLPQTILLIFTILGCEGERLCLKSLWHPTGAHKGKIIIYLRWATRLKFMCVREGDWVWPYWWLTLHHTIYGQAWYAIEEGQQN